MELSQKHLSYSLDQTVKNRCSSSCCHCFITYPAPFHFSLARDVLLWSCPRNGRGWQSTIMKINCSLSLPLTFSSIFSQALYTFDKSYIRVSLLKMLQNQFLYLILAESRRQGECGCWWICVMFYIYVHLLSNRRSTHTLSKGLVRVLCNCGSVLPERL